MKAGMLEDLQVELENCRCKIAGGLAPVWGSRPENQEANDIIPLQRLVGLRPGKVTVSVLFRSQEEVDIPVQRSSGRKKSLLFEGKSDFLFYSDLQMIG